MKKWLKSAWFEKGAISPAHAHYLRKSRLTQLWVWLLRFGILISLIWLWEWSTDSGILDPFLFSSPSRIWQLTSQLASSGELFHHIWLTSWETIVGFLLGTATGIALATLIWASPFLSQVLDPYLVVLNSMPKVALGPLFIVTMGAGFGSILAMAIAITVIVTTLVIHSSFQGVDASYSILARSFGASHTQIFLKIIFPACIPDMIATLKVNVGLAWVGVIVGEFLVSKAGLGYLIIYGFQVFNLTLVMVSLFIVAIISTVMYQLIAWLEQRLLRYRLVS
ncbi:ABC transporter permease [Thermoflavimicrobium dichotomicum]|uniref:NitT/TauT family transport system permease protein n=1 Tax=Thermoflavimicrobium dichotomicum TaxID=46223 RepID=A0A1I3RB27_9BACL|nr:ABC transporter permease [Thermoflavimicrobium dichotomicum]SFJ42571.1 NitT/TauT family transport system permease protein [Thermoflavimicrobium dichotomicum]